MEGRLLFVMTGLVLAGCVGPGGAPEEAADASPGVPNAAAAASAPPGYNIDENFTLTRGLVTCAPSLCIYWNAEIGGALYHYIAIEEPEAWAWQGNLTVAWSGDPATELELTLGPYLDRGEAGRPFYGDSSVVLRGQSPLVWEGTIPRVPEDSTGFLIRVAVPSETQGAPVGAAVSHQHVHVQGTIVSQ